MGIIAYVAQKQGNKVLLKASDGREVLLDSWSDLITELLVQCDFAVTWNLDTFVATIAPLFPKDVQETLKDSGKAFCANHEKLYYQVGRIFAVTYAGREVSFYGLSRYSETAIQDVKELEAFAYKVVEAYAEMGIKATKLTSPVAVYPLGKVNYPRACDLSESAIGLLNATYKTMSREWRDVYQLGHWKADEIFDYDLTAAYPSLMATLPDISKAQFFESDTLPEHYSWGEMTGRLKIVKDVSPFVHEDTENFPKGGWGDSITTDHLWLLRKYGIGEFQIEHGNFFLLPANYSYPFKQVMSDLFTARESQNVIVALIAKAIAVGIGGKLQQRFEDNGKSKLGADFNSIYARMMTSRCMVKLADFIYHNGLNEGIVSVMVDGCLATKRLEVPNVKKMGAWRLNEPSPFLVASMLYQWGNEKKPNGQYLPEVMVDIQKHPQSSVFGDVDLNLLEYSRNFPKRPRTGAELLSEKYISEPYEV